MLSTRHNGERSAGEVNPRREPSAPEVLEGLVAKAEQAGASDLHLQFNGTSGSVCFRVDGVLAPITELSGELAERVAGRIKFLARLKTYQQSLPQDGRIDKAEIGAANDIRVAAYPTVNGEKIVLRLFGGAGKAKTLDELDFPEQVRRELKDFLSQTAGLLLLTGPAGSGKTTTIYACLRHLAEGGKRHIITIEDPAEQIVPGIMQTEINAALGLDFAQAARHLLRQDPQVLVIGEIRDEETAKIALRAALTGHLVVSTLHAGSCRGVFERLSGLYREHTAIATSVELVINQRLVRRVCAACQGEGCSSCWQTGYRGRVPVVESCKVNRALRGAIAKAEFGGIKPELCLRARGRTLVEHGHTNQAEIERVLGTDRRSDEE
jgi:type II secretory ATPase GspE/PulE/Tfp pilus assembly ATPase PilB-like protein